MTMALRSSTAKRPRSGIDTSALPFPKGGKVGRIDKSVLAFGEPERVRDRAYLDSAQGQACECCGRLWHGAVVAAHVNTEQAGGGALKAGDDLTLFLCGSCHHQCDTDPRGVATWITEHIVKPFLRRRYRAWCAGGDRAWRSLNARAVMPETDR